jgi:hypothetical protein
MLRITKQDNPSLNIQHCILPSFLRHRQMAHLHCFVQVQKFLHRIGQVKKLSDNLQFILDTILLSTVVEVQVINL